MPTVEINLTGGSAPHRSKPLNKQITRNFWPQIQQDPGAKYPYVLIEFYGQKLFGSQTGVDRGMFEHKGVLYKLTENTLYSVASDGTHSSLGTVNGSGRAVFTGLGDSVIFTTGGFAWEYDGTTLSQLTDADFESPDTCTSLNSRVIYDGDGGRFAVSDISDASSINALNYATAESKPDDLVSVKAFKQTLYLFGEKTIEAWYNSGVGNPPFERLDGGIIEAGLGAIYSLSNDDESMYFLGDDRNVYSLSGAAGSSVQKISTPTISKEISTYSTVSDAIGWNMQLEGQWFYVLSFPAADKTWVFPTGGQPFEWSSGVSGGRNVANSYAYAYGKHLVAHQSDGNIYELDPDTYTEAGNTIVRLRDSANIHGGIFGAPGKTLEMNRLELIMETGVGLESGQGSDPVVMLSYSDDGGRTFSTERQGSFGSSGEFQKRVEWYALGSFRERIIRVRVSDPVPVRIYHAVADIEVGI